MLNPLILSMKFSLKMIWKGNTAFILGTPIYNSIERLNLLSSYLPLFHVYVQVFPIYAVCMHQDSWTASRANIKNNFKFQTQTDGFICRENIDPSQNILLYQDYHLLITVRCKQFQFYTFLIFFLLGNMRKLVILVILTWVPIQIEKSVFVHIAYLAEFQWIIFEQWADVFEMVWLQVD